MVVTSTSIDYWICRYFLRPAAVANTGWSPRLLTSYNDYDYIIIVNPLAEQKDYVINTILADEHLTALVCGPDLEP